MVEVKGSRFGNDDVEDSYREVRQCPFSIIKVEFDRHARAIVPLLGVALAWIVKGVTSGRRGWQGWAETGLRKEGVSEMRLASWDRISRLFFLRLTPKADIITRGREPHSLRKPAQDRPPTHWNARLPKFGALLGLWLFLTVVTLLFAFLGVFIGVHLLLFWLGPAGAWIGIICAVALFLYIPLAWARALMH
jgi:hypothetical protein